MISFQTYLRNKKVELIKESYVDFKADFNVELDYGSGFTRSDFFHFVIYDGKKYVHKKAFEFLLTNGETFLVNVENPKEFMVNKNVNEIVKHKANVVKMFEFFRSEINKYEIYPKLLNESEHFFVFEYYGDEDYEEILDLKLEDAKYISLHYKKATKGKNEVVTPFFNQMYHKILRHKHSKIIKIRDIKGLEFHDNEALGILFYNDAVNVYYLLERRYILKSMILAPFKNDYKVKATQMIKLY